MANAGAIRSPSAKKSTAAISQSTSCTRGVVDGSLDNPSLDATQTAAAPSDRGEELPAVSEPVPEVRSKAGGSLARFSREGSQRGMVSRLPPATRITKLSKKPP